MVRVKRQSNSTPSLAADDIPSSGRKRVRRAIAADGANTLSVVDIDTEITRARKRWKKMRMSAWRRLVEKCWKDSTICWLHPALRAIDGVRDTLIDTAIANLEVFYQSDHVAPTDHTLKDVVSSSSDNDVGDEDEAGADEEVDDGRDDREDADETDRKYAITAKRTIDAKLSRPIRLLPPINTTRLMERFFARQAPLSMGDRCGGSEWQLELRAHPWAVRGSLYGSQHLSDTLELFRGVDGDRLPVPGGCNREHSDRDSDEEDSDDDSWQRKWKTEACKMFCTKLQETYAHLYIDYLSNVLIPIVQSIVRVYVPVFELGTLVAEYLVDPMAKQSAIQYAKRWCENARFGSSPDQSSWAWERMSNMHTHLNVSKHDDLLVLIHGQESRLKEMERTLAPLLVYLKDNGISPDGDISPTHANRVHTGELIRAWSSSQKLYAPIPDHHHHWEDDYKMMIDMSYGRWSKQLEDHLDVVARLFPPRTSSKRRLNLHLVRIAIAMYRLWPDTETVDDIMNSVKVPRHTRIVRRAVRKAVEEHDGHVMSDTEWQLLRQTMECVRIMAGAPPRDKSICISYKVISKALIEHWQFDPNSVAAVLSSVDRVRVAVDAADQFSYDTVHLGLAACLSMRKQTPTTERQAYLKNALHPGTIGQRDDFKSTDWGEFCGTLRRCSRHYNGNVVNKEEICNALRQHWGMTSVVTEEVFTSIKRVHDAQASEEIVRLVFRNHFPDVSDERLDSFMSFTVELAVAATF